MSKYTFILDYLGGTYISQIIAKNENVAMEIWIQKLDVDEIKDFSINDKNSIIKSKFEDETPILLKDIENTWHFLINTKKGVGYINFVKTCSSDCKCK